MSTNFYLNPDKTTPASIERLLRLPTSPLLLRELNLPKDLTISLAGRTVAVQVLAEEQPCTRQLSEPDEYPCLTGKDGTIWNDYRPVRVLFSGPDGREWRFPRHWLNQIPEDSCKELSDSGKTAYTEVLNLPTLWDLADINITSVPPRMAGGGIARVFVKVSSQGLVKVYVRHSDGNVWRIPSSWRRRRIMLPDSDALAEQGVPEDIAHEFGHQIVTVNYHPGSLCCLEKHYRFRDGRGGKWPVRITDCIIVGFGNGPELRA